MTIKLALTIALAVFLWSTVHAQNRDSTLPDRIINAKTVFLQDDSGEPKFADNVYRQGA